MPKKKTHKVIKQTCPHRDCGVSFSEPIVEKGILFCPHCENSILLAEPLSLEEVNQRNSTLYNKQESLSIESRLFIFMPLIIIPMSIARIQGWEDISFLLSMIIVSIFIFEIYKIYSRRLSYRLKHNKIEFIAGVDGLSDIYKFSEMEAEYANNEGILVQAPCYLNKTELPKLKTCPHCTSQMVVKLPSVVGWKKDLYSKYDVSRPKGMPNSGYCAATDRYVDSDPTLSNIFLCFHCHTHYSWLDMETDTLFKSVEGAPQLYSITELPNKRRLHAF